MSIKIYIIIGVIVATLIAIICNYIIRSEKIKSDLLKETRMQQITIDTLAQAKKKQENLIIKYEELLQKKQQALQELQTQHKQSEDQLEQSTQLLQKQKLLNGLFQ